MILCGRLPLNCDPTAFLAKPANIDKTSRSAEGNYSRDYARLANDVGLAAASLPKQKLVLEKEEGLTRAHTTKINELEARLQRFYKKLDDYRFDMDTLFGSQTSTLNL